MGQAGQGGAEPEKLKKNVAAEPRKVTTESGKVVDEPMLLFYYASSFMKYFQLSFHI